jgi:hypothetical protein
VEQDQKETRQIELFNQHNLLGNNTMLQTQQCNRRQQPANTILARNAKEIKTVPFVPSGPIYDFTVSGFS